MALTYSNGTYVNAAKVGSLLQASFTAITPFGMLYAIRPSACGGVGDLRQSDLYGYHVIGIPNTEITGTYLYLVGSNVAPGNLSTKTFNQSLPLDAAMARGLMVFSPAYVNDNTIGTLCGADGTCYGPVRQETCFGDANYTAVVSVNSREAIIGRFQGLVDYCKAQLGGWLLYPVGIAGPTVEWSRIRGGGHSQGAGHILTIAQRYEMEWVSLYSGPTDNGNGLAVDWVPTNNVGSATPLARIRGVAHEQDLIATGGGTDWLGITANYAKLGMVRSTVAVADGTETKFDGNWVAGIFDVLAAGGTFSTAHNTPAYNALFDKARTWAMGY